MPPDPCQSFIDRVTALTRSLVAQEASSSHLHPHHPDPATLQSLREQLAIAEAQLAACRRSNRSVIVSGPPAAGMAAFDKAIEAFMLTNSVTAGQLTVMKGGAIQLQHGYTGSWSTHIAAQPTSLFRIASCSKAFTSAAIQTLYDAKSLLPTDTVFPLLGIAQAALSSQTVDARVDGITVQQLIDHAGGWNDHAAFVAPDGTTIPSSTYDPVFYTREIALALGLSGPPTKRDLARWLYGEPLQFAPGAFDFVSSAGNSYSNIGYVLLGLVVEAKSGMPYIDYLRDRVLSPLGISDVFVSRMLAGPVYPREIAYDDPGVGPNGLEPHASVQAPFTAGGNDLVTELCDSAGGLMSTATALCQLIGHFFVWGNGTGRAAGSARAGSEAGVSSFASSRANGVDFVYVFNTRAFQNDPLPALDTTLSGLCDALP